LRARESGRAQVHVVVGPAGRVIACAVEPSSGSGVLDAATCRILRARARYRPARDAAGAAVCDMDSGWIQWTLPRRILIPWARPARRYGPLPLRYQLAPGACPVPAPAPARRAAGSGP
jgi:TonB family protein